MAKTKKPKSATVTEPKALSCPFYARGIHELPVSTGDFPHDQRGVEIVLMPNPGNRCALVTTAHSPCYMEVRENLPPDWSECVRNPMFVASHMATIDDPDQFENTEKLKLLRQRVRLHDLHMWSLRMLHL